MTAKEAIEITLGCYDRETIISIESEIVKAAENGKNFLDVLHMFDYDLDYEFMCVIESYFKQNGFDVNFYKHTNPDYRNFVISW